jgi:hypothetical protein
LKRALDTAATNNGRSQSQEFEMRLARSFERQALLSDVLALRYGSKEIAGLLMMIGMALQNVRRLFELRALDGLPADEPYEVSTGDKASEWLNDPYVFEQLVQSIVHLLNATRPPDASPQCSDMSTFGPGASLARQIAAFLRTGALDVINPMFSTSDDPAELRSLLGPIADRTSA